MSIKLNFSIFTRSYKSVGLDISDTHIEAVELVGQGQNLQMTSQKRHSLPAGVIEKGMIKDRARLKSAIQQTLAEAQPQSIQTKSVIFGLPESQTYIYILKLLLSG